MMLMPGGGPSGTSFAHPGKLDAPGVEEGPWTDKQSVDLLARHVREGRVDVAASRDPVNQNLLIGGGRFYVTHCLIATLDQSD
jgi:hypothetical protein